ncbi:hypothetical protein ACLJYM_02300 [Rhizobium giardinii]|uniref:hypothetical protein n=1 Tax=Rhizobium giardinii TaxID=56731 RepID=UPI0039E0DFC2
MGSIENKRNHFTNVVVSAASFYSALFQQVAVFTGLAAAGFFAATTQVWQYPVPRLDFALMCGGLLFIAITAYWIYLTADAATRILQNGYFNLGVMAFVLSLIMSLVFISGVSQLSINERLKCLADDLAVCVQEHPSNEPATTVR